jgi:hypothetical protein
MLRAVRKDVFLNVSSRVFTAAATLSFLAPAPMAQEVEELPPIVVEGATLAKPSAAKKSGSTAGQVSPPATSASASATEN